MRYTSSLNDATDNMLGDFFQVAPDERVIITADTNTDPKVTRALMDSAQRRGAQPTLIVMPPLPYQGGLADPYIPQSCSQAVEGSDVWIDATFPYMAGSAMHDALMAKKHVRYLLLGDANANVVTRLFGETDLDEYFAAQAMFDEIFGQGDGAKCRITCPRGTDVSFNLGISGLNKPRYATEPGMYVVPGSCSIPPDIDTVKGRIVISAVFHTFYELLQQPIVIEVDQHIVRVEGAGASALAFERAIKRAVNDGMGSIIHFTHGLLPRARVTGRSFIEDMRAVGNNAVGFGMPWWLPGGGETHPDGVVFGHSVWVNERQVIKDGRIVWPEKLVRFTDAIET